MSEDRLFEPLDENNLPPELDQSEKFDALYREKNSAVAPFTIPGICNFMLGQLLGERPSITVERAIHSDSAGEVYFHFNDIEYMGEAKPKAESLLRAFRSLISAFDITPALFPTLVTKPGDIIVKIDAETLQMVMEKFVADSKKFQETLYAAQSTSTPFTDRLGDRGKPIARK